jgi:3-oxoacyl-[acyl-carrier-protein] synthase-1
VKPQPFSIAISGAGLGTALGTSLPSCVDALRAGRQAVQGIRLEGFDPVLEMPYYRIPDSADLFAPERFDRLLAQAAWEALEGAKLKPSEIAELPIFVGSSAFSVSKSEAQYKTLLEKNPKAACALPLVGFEHIAQSLRNSLGSKGPSFSFNTACTASGNAVLAACRMLASGRFKHALVAGLELANVTTLSGFSGLQLIAQSLKPFDANRQGIVLGEGVGVLLLSADQGKPGAVIKAGAANLDPHSVTTANPDGSSIAALTKAVLAQAGLDSSQITGIKAHGTASPMNDAGEALGLRAVFKELPPLFALKPYTGHTLGACGVNELALLAGALKAGFIPGTPGFETEDPALGVRPSREALPAKAGNYLLNYFGFGGHNTALIMEWRP